MVKHSQTIRQLLPANRLSVFDHFVELLLRVKAGTTVEGSQRYKPPTF